MADKECLLAVCEGEVFFAGPIGDASTIFARYPDTTEVVRMPVAAAGLFLFQPWPGREAALEALASEPLAIELLGSGGSDG